MIQKRRRLKSLQKRIRERKANEPRPYAYRSTENAHMSFLTGKGGGIWSKIVVAKPPYVYEFDRTKQLIGPFRSEVDCEEFCDRENIYECRNMISFYTPQTIPKQEKV